MIYDLLTEDQKDELGSHLYRHYNWDEDDYAEAPSSYEYWNKKPPETKVYYAKLVKSFLQKLDDIVNGG